MINIIKIYLYYIYAHIYIINFNNYLFYIKYYG